MPEALRSTDDGYSGSDAIEYGFVQEFIRMNSDHLENVLIKMQASLSERPRPDPWIAGAGVSLSILLALLTADFHAAFGLNKDEVHVMAVMFLLISLVATGVLLARWIAGTHGYKPKTPEEIVAEALARSRADRLRMEDRAAARQSVIQQEDRGMDGLAEAMAVEEEGEPLRTLKNLRSEAEVLKRSTPAFKTQNAPGSESGVMAWEEQVHTALSDLPTLQSQFANAPTDNPILAALSAHPATIRLTAKVGVLDSIIKHLEQ